MRILMLIMDGLGDTTYARLGNKTPLEAARTRNLNKMAHVGETGLMYTIGPGITPGSDTAHLALFGYDPFKYYQGRGVYEALGAGITLKKGDVAFRVNFATKRNGKIIDRRAGRNGCCLEELANELDGQRVYGVKVVFKQTTEHRGVVVLRGRGLAKDVTDTDPHRVGSQAMKAKPTKNTQAAKTTAKIVNKLVTEFEEIAKNAKANAKRKRKGLLPANTILLRGAGMYSKIPSIKDRYGMTASCIAGGALYKGVAKAVGMEVLDVPGATGDKNTNLGSKAEYAINSDANFVFLHIKATDSFAHDKDYIGKRNFIEKVDREVISRVMNEFDAVFISGDHSTFSTIGEHTASPVPILIYGDKEIIRPDRGLFSERDAAMGIHRITGLNVMPILLSKTGMVGKYGE